MFIASKQLPVLYLPLARPRHRGQQASAQTKFCWTDNAYDNAQVETG